MSEQEFTTMENAPVVELKRKKLFEEGTTVIAAIASADWMQGQFSPGVAVEYRTLSPEVGCAIRQRAWLSKAKKTEELYVKNGGELDLLQQAALTDAEFLSQAAVNPQSWVGRPVAFVLDKKSYENEDGEELFVNIVRDGSTRKPTDEELASVQDLLASVGVLSTNGNQKELSAAEEDSEDVEDVEAPF